MNSIRRFASVVGIAAFLCVVATAGAAGHANARATNVGSAGAGHVTASVGIIGTGKQR